MEFKRALKTHFGAPLLKSASIAICIVGIAQAAPPESNTQNDSSANPQGIAVLMDGRVLKGQIQEISGGYLIENNLGTITVPYDQISMTSASLDMAYESYKSLITEPSADVHLRLAKWCIANGLWPQAYVELQAALKLDPRRAETLELLKQIDLLVNSKPHLEDAETVKKARGMSAVTFATTQRTSAGFEPSLQVHYNRTVQPILMNSCVSGGCHGPESVSGLKLTKVGLSSPSFKSATERNQKALMEWIDFANADRSPLLVQAVDGSEYHKQNFTGRKGEHYVEIQNWVREVVKQSPDARKIAEKRQRAEQGSEIQQVSATKISSQSAVTHADAEFGPSNPLWKSADSKPVNDLKLVPVQYSEELQEARKQNRPDAFDPRKFNELMMKAPPQGQNRIPKM